MIYNQLQEHLQSFTINYKTIYNHLQSFKEGLTTIYNELQWTLRPFTMAFTIIYNMTDEQLQ